MAREEQQQKKRQYHNYIDGSAVRHSETVPKRESERSVPRPQRREQRVAAARIRRNRDKVQHISVPYLIVLVAATIMALGVCVSYLQVQASITANKNQIEKLESNLQTLKSDNNALEARISTYVDLKHIYEVATGELGMVYPSDDQILYYDKTESGYVRQYEDIPTD